MKSFKLNPFRYMKIVLLSISFIGFKTHAQLINGIDKKGNIINIQNNQVITATTAPVDPLENDIWFDNTDTNNVITKVYDGTTWQNISTGSTWNTLGNTGTSSTTNFLGTTDAQSLVVKTNNIEAARFTNEAVGTNSKFLLNAANVWSGVPGSSNLIGLNTTTNNQRLRLTSGSSDTQNDSQGASIDLFGNSTITNGGRLDLVAGSNASGINNAITFWGNDGAATPTQAQRMVINGQGNVGIGNIAPNVNAVLDLTNTDHRALLLPSETLPTGITTPEEGMLVYASGRTNAYLRTDNVWKPIAYNNVSNELIFDGKDDADAANDNFYYVSFVINDNWKVVRYDKTDANLEATADETSNGFQTTQPLTLAACTALTF